MFFLDVDMCDFSHDILVLYLGVDFGSHFSWQSSLKTVLTALLYLQVLPCVSPIFSFRKHVFLCLCLAKSKHQVSRLELCWRLCASTGFREVFQRCV